jgi:hypothetical protein
LTICAEPTPDGLAKTRKHTFFVNPAQAGIQSKLHALSAIGNLGVIGGGVVLILLL